jgi:osmotically-inducible protein OsmY
MMRNLRLLVALAIVPAVVSGLYGCAAAVVGGVGTALVVADDRRTVGTVAEDQTIEIKAGSRLGDRSKGAHINVTSYNRLVLLTGEAPDQAVKADVEKIARSVENVRGVYNEITVGDNRSLSARANDTVLTGKVKARFVDAQKFNPVHVKVVTEGNAVYLLGMVKRKEADDATEIARTTGGVQKVVKLFEYLD